MKKPKFSKLSVDVIDYLVERHGLSQIRISEILDVDRSFITRVRKDQRELSIDHLETLANHIGVDMGIMMLQAVRPTKAPKDPRKLRVLELCEQFVTEAAVLRATLRKRAQA